MNLIDDLKRYKKRVLNDSYHNLSVVTGIEKDRLKEIIEKSAPVDDDEKYHIERLIY